ncbi:hypothetical protein C8R45DRAFT_940606 [Mycena sanguinolenta]|nr:hypothetical protein C8R45DRAFT_940606 [Mycena sanguinolenta]
MDSSSMMPVEEWVRGVRLRAQEAALTRIGMTGEGQTRTVLTCTKRDVPAGMHALVWAELKHPSEPRWRRARVHRSVRRLSGVRIAFMWMWNLDVLQRNRGAAAAALVGIAVSLGASTTQCSLTCIPLPPLPIPNPYLAHTSPDPARHAPGSRSRLHCANRGRWREREDEDVDQSGGKREDPSAFSVACGLHRVDGTLCKGQQLDKANYAGRVFIPTGETVALRLMGEIRVGWSFAKSEKHTTHTQQTQRSTLCAIQKQREIVLLLRAKATKFAEFYLAIPFSEKVKRLQFSQSQGSRIQIVYDARRNRFITRKTDLIQTQQ